MRYAHIQLLDQTHVPDALSAIQAPQTIVAAPPRRAAWPPFV
jgi:hypothetical protein